MNNNYTIAKINNWLFSDDDAEKLLKSNEYKLIADYGKDEKFILYIPYVPLLITIMDYK